MGTSLIPGRESISGMHTVCNFEDRCSTSLLDMCGRNFDQSSMYTRSCQTGRLVPGPSSRPALGEGGVTMTGVVSRITVPNSAALL